MKNIGSVIAVVFLLAVVGAEVVFPRSDWEPPPQVEIPQEMPCLINRPFWGELTVEEWDEKFHDPRGGVDYAVDNVISRCLEFHIEESSDYSSQYELGWVRETCNPECIPEFFLALSQYTRDYEIDRIRCALTALYLDQSVVPLEVIRGGINAETLYYEVPPKGLGDVFKAYYWTCKVRTNDETQ